MTTENNDVFINENYLVCTKKKNKALFVILISMCLGIGFILFSYLTNREQQPTDVLAHWEQNHPIYQIEGVYLGQGDFAIGLEIDTAKQAFYHYLSDHHQGFIMNAQNIWWLNEGFYPYIDMETAPPMELSPVGYRIDICLNYLSLNPITTLNGISIEDQVDWDLYVLNLLVPEHLMPYESEIKQLYLEDFYFQQVIVDNFYNEVLGLPLNSTSIDELSINIIYVESGQSYLSFDNILQPGVDERIFDPIAVIYTGNVHQSNLGTWFTTNSVFFQTQTEIDDAYLLIEYILLAYGLEKAIPAVYRINEYINQRII